MVGALLGNNYVLVAKPSGERVKVHVERLKPYKERLSEESGSERSDESDEELDAESYGIVEVDPDPAMLPNDLIGKRIRTWWPAEKQWFDGVVESREKRRHVVRYDDGEIRNERLISYGKTGAKWKLLERRRSDGFDS